MDSLRSSLPNVDRANSTLFKRYLEEQHKSVAKSSNNQQVPYPINSTAQIGHEYQQHQDISTSESQNLTYRHPAMVKETHSNEWRPSRRTSRQRTSHTSRFMKRFERIHKSRDNPSNVQKHNGRSRFKYHDSSCAEKNIPNQESGCTCIVSSNRKDESLPFSHAQHNHLQPHHGSTNRLPEVSHGSLNEPFHSFSPYQHDPIELSTLLKLSPKPHQLSMPMSTTTVEKSPSLGSTSNLTNLHEPIPTQPLSIPMRPTANTEHKTLFPSTPPLKIREEDRPMIDNLLHEISVEMDEKMNIRALLEIEELLARRIYDCIVKEDTESGHQPISCLPATDESSAPSTAPQQRLNNTVSNRLNDLQSSSISSLTTREIIHRRKTYFQPIRERSEAIINAPFDRNQRPISSNGIAQKILPVIPSPFMQSLLEPVNLLRTLSNDNQDDLHILPSLTSFENSQGSKMNLPLFEQHNQSKTRSSTMGYISLPIFDDILSRTTPANTKNSAFQPIQPAAARSKTIFELKRPQPLNNSIPTNWFEDI